MTTAYLLNTDQQGVNRLETQAKLYNPASQQLLKDAGLSEGQSVLEVGCGTGTMTTWLCEQVGQQGAVCAIDITPEYVTAVQQLVAPYPQAHVQQLDITKDPIPGHFDVIYCRMVLHHLAHPKAVLSKLSQRLNPNGKIVCEEPPAMAQCFTYPPSPAFERFIDLVLKTFRANGKDYEIAYTQYEHLASLGLTLEKQQTFQPLLNQEERALHLMGLRDVSPALLAQNVATPQEVTVLTQEVTQALSNAEIVSLYKLFQVIACNKAGS